MTFDELTRQLAVGALIGLGILIAVIAIIIRRMGR